MKSTRKCPLLLRSSDLATEARRSLRRLAKLVDACAACPRGDECDQAIQVEDALVRCAHDILEKVEG
jgi:hypothetical protein